MTFQPLFDAPLAIQVHVAAVVPAAVLGTIILLRPKGGVIHRALGKIWMVLMTVTAVSSFLIHEINLVYGFSPIHLLSLVTLFVSWQAVSAARHGQIARHRALVKQLYFGGIVGAGLFTLVPGRIMNAMVFGEGALLPVIIAAFFLVAVYLLWRRFKQNDGQLDLRRGRDV